MRKTLLFILSAALVSAATVWILWTSVDFQGCLQANHSVSTVIQFRHCAGTYVVDNNSAITAIGTLFIAIFTTVLGLFTVSLANSTRIAAQAAELSARAAIALELPLIRAEPVGFGFGDSREGDGPLIENFGLQCFEFRNLGRTKAFPMELVWGWTVGDRLPRTPAYRERKRFDLKAIINAEDGNVLLYVREFTMPLSTGGSQKITARPSQANLWLYCRLTYEDFMYQEHEISFCWKRYEAFGAGTFVPDATPAYNTRT
jgi:hypothetical protein